MSRVALILLPLFVAQAGGCQGPDRFAAWPVEDDPKQVVDKDGPWFVLDFDDYDTVEQVEAVPGVRLSALQTHTLTTDLEDTPWGGTKAMRLNFPVALSGVDMGAGIEIIPPDRGTVRPREIWVEVWTRVGPTWTTEGIEKPAELERYTGSHKFLLMFDDAESDGYRWEDMQGVFATQGEHQVMISGGTKGIGRAPHTFEYDGDWHRYRYHALMDEVNGRFMLDMDGVKQIGFEGAQRTSAGPDRYFGEIQFGANNNRGTDGVNDMWYELAEIRIYATDPGWVLP